MVDADLELTRSAAQLHTEQSRAEHKLPYTGCFAAARAPQQQPTPPPPKPPQQKGAQKWEAQEQVTPEKTANALKLAGNMGDAGVKAGLVVVGAEAAAAGAVVAAPAAIPAVSSTASQVLTTATSALAAARTAMNNAATAGLNFAKQVVVTVDTVRSGGGALQAVADFGRALTPGAGTPNNPAGRYGFAVKAALRLLSPD